MSIQSFLSEYRQHEQRVIHMRRLKSRIPVFVILLVRFLKASKCVLADWLAVTKNLFFPPFRNFGYCPCCRKKTVFAATNLWLRDSFFCVRCNSLPRDRQVYKYINETFKDRTDLRVLEFAPLPGSYMHDRKTKSFVMSHYFQDEKFGKVDADFYNEDIQKTTFGDGSFDLIIHEDILEHINDPFQALSDNLRILADNGMIVFTCPVRYDGNPTQQMCAVSDSGDLVYYHQPVYHGNPIDAKGSLVFWDYGYDFEQRLRDKLPANIEITHIDAQDPRMGIMGEMVDLFCIRKLPAGNAPEQ